MSVTTRIRLAVVGTVLLAGCSADTADDDTAQEENVNDVQQEVGTRPNFLAPFPRGQTWTYSHHSGEVRRALDFVNTAGATNLQPVLASAPGTATRLYQAGGAGNYVSIDHGGGWKTYYFHLSSYSVPSGARVAAGQEIGRVGSTGASTGPHLHYEQLLNGVGQSIVINGKSLAPYPASYGQASLTSTNGTSSGGGGACSVHADGKLYCSNTPGAAMHSEPNYGSPVVNHLRTNPSWFECWKKGQLHPGGNTTWYRTIGDDNANRGFVPAVQMGTSSAFDNNPVGLAACP